MSYIITDNKHYKNIAKALRSKLQTDRKYKPEEMATAITSISSPDDKTDNPVAGVFYLDPDEEGNPRKVKIVNYKNGGRLTDVFHGAYTLKLREIEFVNSDFSSTANGTFEGSSLQKIEPDLPLANIPYSCFGSCRYLQEITLRGTRHIGTYSFTDCNSLRKIYIPKSCIDAGWLSLAGCTALEDAVLESGFNGINLNFSYSTKYSHDTILSWFNALADRTELASQTLTIGNTNLKKMSAEEVKIATKKNWIVK